MALDKSLSLSGLGTSFIKYLEESSTLESPCFLGLLDASLGFRSLNVGLHEDLLGYRVGNGPARV